MTARSLEITDRVCVGRGASVTRLGFGTAPIAGLFEAIGPEEAARTLHAAWEAGVRYFDTAPHYGAGLAEQRLGHFLAGKPRDEATVSTKVGRLLVPGAPQPGEAEFYGTPDLVRVRDYTAEGVYRCLAESIERSTMDQFDILLIHDPDAYWDQAVGEAYPALARLRDEGAVKAIGVGMNTSDMLARFVAETDLDCVMLAGRYTLLDRTGGDTLLPLCQARGVAVLAAGVFKSGILIDPAPGARFDYEPAPQRLLDRARSLAAVCSAYDVPLAAAAMRFPLRHPAVASVVVGARTAEEIIEDARLASMPIPDQLWSELDTALAVS